MANFVPEIFKLRADAGEISARPMMPSHEQLGDAVIKIRNFQRENRDVRAQGYYD